jgi:DNA-binding CsgD family transcriptional regulator
MYTVAMLKRLNIASLGLTAMPLWLLLAIIDPQPFQEADSFLSLLQCVCFMLAGSLSFEPSRRLCAAFGRRAQSLMAALCGIAAASGTTALAILANSQVAARILMACLIALGVSGLLACRQNRCPLVDVNDQGRLLAMGIAFVLLLYLAVTYGLYPHARTAFSCLLPLTYAAAVMTLRISPRADAPLLKPQLKPQLRTTAATSALVGLGSGFAQGVAFAITAASPGLIHVTAICLALAAGVMALAANSIRRLIGQGFLPKLLFILYAASFVILTILPSTGALPLFMVSATLVCYLMADDGMAKSQMRPAPLKLLIIAAGFTVGATTALILSLPAFQEGLRNLPLAVVFVFIVFILALYGGQDLLQRGQRELPGTSAGETGAPLRRFDSIAHRHKLTEREHEVLALLINGRNAIHIAERLGITKNTAKSHIRNIYVKTGVHDKQELLNMVLGE